MLGGTPDEAEIIPYLLMTIRLLVIISFPLTKIKKYIPAGISDRVICDSSALARTVLIVVPLFDTKNTDIFDGYDVGN